MLTQSATRRGGRLSDPDHASPRALPCTYNSNSNETWWSASAPNGCLLGDSHFLSGEPVSHKLSSELGVGIGGIDVSNYFPGPNRAAVFTAE